MGLELAVVETADEPLVAEHPEIAPELALQGFEGVRAYAARRGAEPAAPRGDARLRAAWRLGLGGARRAARRLVHLRAAARGARCRRCRHRASRRLRLDARRPRGLAAPRGRGGNAADAGDRPLLLPLRLLPRAERRALRARDARPGLRDRRGSGAPRRAALAAARVRAPARADRAGADAAAGSRAVRGRSPDRGARPRGGGRAGGGARSLPRPRRRRARPLSRSSTRSIPSGGCSGSRRAGRSRFRPEARTGTRSAGSRRPTRQPSGRRSRRRRPGSTRSPFRSSGRCSAASRRGR